MNNQQAAQIRPVVVIPIYTLNFSQVELLALRRTLQVLAAHDVAFVKPQSLDVSNLPHLLGLPQSWTIESFPDYFFAGRKGYNRLMMSADLYERFLAWDYMLVVQADVLIFDDQLMDWCLRGYDYVGAPWLPDARAVTGFYPLHRLAWGARKAWAKLSGGFHTTNLKYHVGNGGFSLRRIATMHDIASKHRDDIERILSQKKGPEGFEDVFWSVTAPKLAQDNYAVAPWREALLFSVESHPDLAMHYTQSQLPFGTHAFGRRRNQREWRHWTDINAILRKDY